MQLFNYDSVYYSEQVKNKKVTVLELTTRALDNIETLDDHLNSVIHLKKEKAIRKAKEMDEQLKHMSQENIQQLPPFFGVPILIKDLGQTEAGEPSISGSKLFKDNIAKETSNFVRRIIEIGFVIIGRTNVPEFGFKGVTDPELFGHTYSPLGHHLSPRVSSGGSAAALKAGLIPLASGSDGGGSIRIPASFNGLIGLKPTRGLTPTGPSEYRSWQGASINFFLTKSVRETSLLLNSMNKQPLASPYLPPQLNTAPLRPVKKKLRIAYNYESSTGTEITQEAKDSLTHTVNILKNLGHEVIMDAPNVDGKRAMDTYFTMNMVETAAMFKNIENTKGSSIQKNDVELISYGMYKAGLRVAGWQYVQALNFWDLLSKQYHQFLDDNNYDFYLTPTINGPAVDVDAFNITKETKDKLEHIDELNDEEALNIFNEVFKKSTVHIPYAQHANLTGQPALTLPLYETKEKLPIGSMFVARKGEDNKLLELALQIENAGFIKSNIIDLT